MSRTVVRAALLAAIYLLVLTSLAPGDVLVGALLGLAVALALRGRGPTRASAPLPERLAAAGALALETAAEMVRGSWRVARFCLGSRRARPNFVEIPRDARSRRETALWGVLTGEAPDEVVVDVRRDSLLVHVVDAGDPEAVRARHAAARERWLRKLVS